MMNDSPPTAPTLLSLTAPKRRESVPPAAEAGFAEELAAVSPPEQTKRSERKSESERSSAAPTDEADNNAKISSDDATPTDVTTSDESTTEETATEGSPPDDGLLVVSVAIETLVLETPPDVQLPQEATTTLDVSLESSIEVTPSVDGVPVDATLFGKADASTSDQGHDSLPAEGENPAAAAPSVVEPIDSLESLPSLESSAGSAEVVAKTAPEFDAVRTTEAISSSAAIAPADTEAATPSAVTSTEAVTATPETEAVAALAPVEEGLESGEEQEGDSNSGRPKPAVPLLSAANASAEAGDTAVEPTTERAPLPTLGGANPARPGSAITATGQQAAEPPPTIDPTRFVSRVARAFDFAQERGGGPIEIRLSPPELGSMQVKIELKEGIMTASLDVETPAARSALLDNLPALRERLEQQQIRIESFDVDVREDSGQRGGDWQPGGGPSDDSPEDRREPAATTSAAPTDSEEGSEVSGVSTIHFGDDAINLVA